MTAWRKIVTGRHVWVIARFVVAGTLLVVPLGSGGMHRVTLGGAGVGEASAPARGLGFVQTVFTGHGNAGHLAWGDDGKSLFLANEEGRMSAVKIDVSDPTKPFVAATNNAENFLWATAQHNGLLVFQQSYGRGTLRLDPSSFAVQWKHDTGTSHAVATDGSRVYVPIEGKPGTLVILGSNGQELGRVSGSDGWGSVYGTEYAADTHRLYVAAGADPPKGIEGGIYIYDVSGTTPVLKGRILVGASDIAVRGTRLWTHDRGALETWDVADPAHPALRGVWEAQIEKGPGEALVQRHYGVLTLNKAGTRLYAAYGYHDVKSGRSVSDWYAGFVVFDASGPKPRQLAQQDWKVEGECRFDPVAVSLSPDAKTLAVSYWRFGVRLFGVAGDTVTDLGAVGTTGEARDVYVDSRGTLYVFANDNLQVINPQIRRILKVIPFCNGGPVDGGWKPFKAGTIISRWAPIVWDLRNDVLVSRQFLSIRGLGVAVWDNAFEDPYLYSGGDDGTLFVESVSGNGPFDATVVGSTRVPRADGALRGEAHLMAVAKQGNLVWTLGPTVGLAAIDVRNPTVPQLVFQDKFTFFENGGHIGLVVAHGRVYAGAGDAGVRIYDAATFKRTGSIPGLTVNFLDLMAGDYLVVANYWHPKLPEGVYVYDLRANPDAPTLFGRFPETGGSPNFRVRVFDHRVYRVALYGIDILEGP